MQGEEYSGQGGALLPTTRARYTYPGYTTSLLYTTVTALLLPVHHRDTQASYPRKEENTQASLPAGGGLLVILDPRVKESLLF